MILALDLGTTFGYAFSDGRSGSFSLMSDDRRYLRFMRWLASNTEGVTGVAYERVTFRQKSGAAADVYGGLRAVLIAFCEENDLPLTPVTVQTIKKHATGDARADKVAMIVAARKRGWNPGRHDEADALWLLDFVTSGHVSTSANTPAASKALDGVKPTRPSKSSRERSTR